jgi:Uma2 family endonuclease
MATAHRPTAMTADEFLEWCQEQSDRYELVDGVPVALRAMAGASTAHDRIASNIIGLLFPQLRGTGCWATTPDTAVRTSIKNVRRPDVTIECAPPQQKAYEAKKPVAIVEILSFSTTRNGKLAKLPEYMRHPTVQTIVLVETEQRDVLVYQRDETGDWQALRLLAETDEIKFSGTCATLTLASVYEDVPLSA